MSVEELINQEVTVATKSSQKLTQTPSVVSVITAEEIQALGIREISEILGIIPGFQISGNRSGVKIVSARGVSDFRQGGRFLFLIDGVPYNGVMYGSGVYFGGEYNIDDIERVEIIRGPGSALYGRNAFSSVVNFITKKAITDNSVEVGASYGSFNSADIHCSYQVKKENFSSYLNAKYYTTDGTNSKFNNGKGGEDLWNLTHDNFYLNGNARYKNVEFIGLFVYRDDGTSYGPYLTHANTIFKIGSYTLKYNKDLSSKINLGIKLYGKNENRIQNFISYEANTTDNHPLLGIPVNSIAPEGIIAKPVFDDYIYGIEAETKIQLLKSNQLLLGIQADLHGIKNASVSSNYNLKTGYPLFYLTSDSTPQQYSADNMPLYEPGWIIDGGHKYGNLAIYFQNIHYFTKSLGITLGGRLDFDSETGIMFNPRLGAVWDVNKYLTTKILYGEAYRAPTTNEQFKIIGNDWGNKDLNDEEIKTTELVFNINTDKSISQIAFYYNFLDNIILQQFVDTTYTIKSYYNAGENKSYGVDIENKIFLTSNLYAFVNYSYNQSKDYVTIDDTTYSLPHPNIAHHHFNIGLNYRITKKISINCLVRYLGEMVKFYTGGGPLPMNNISQDKVGDFYLLNSSIIFTNLIKGLDVSLYGFNLLNTKYYFQDDQNQHQPAQPSINFLLKVNYRFN